MSSSSSPAQRSITAFFKRTPQPNKAHGGHEGDAHDENRPPNAMSKAEKRTKPDGDHEDPVVTPKKAREEGEEGDECPSPASSPALTPDQKSRMRRNEARGRLLQLCRSGGLSGALHPDMGLSWFEALRPVVEGKRFRGLSEFVGGERGRATVFPPPEDVWSWTKFFDVKDTKVVILGQDPYHGPRQAHGLCFSVRKGVAAPPSLENMFKELQQDVEGFARPSHGDLTGWARQGVLLLNACLTVRQGQANSHKDKGWEDITDAAIKAVSDQCNGVVFLLWGSFAQKKASSVNGKKHHLLKTVHPSPLSAYRGFFGCKHFSKCNDLLKKDGKDPIDWSALD